MLGYIQSDGGRAKAGRKGHAGDCVVRALVHVLHGAHPTGEQYLAIYRELAEANALHNTYKNRAGVKSASNGVCKKAYESVFGAHGLAKVVLPRGERPTWTQAHNRYGDCVVSTARHLAAVVDGNLLDTADRREYLWANEETGEVETRERKAMSVYRLVK